MGAHVHPVNNLRARLSDRPGMGRDTTDDTTRRPSVPEALDDELAAAVTEHVRIPADRLTFADRLRVLLEEYQSRGDRIQELEAEVDELEEQLTEARSDGIVRR